MQVARASSTSIEPCDKCDAMPGVVLCSCDNQYCEECFQGHLKRRRGHRRSNRMAESAWNWISGKLAHLTSPQVQFKDDESTKWFGLCIETNRQRDRLTSIVETKRLQELMTVSLNYRDSSPKRQFPSITSFVGETGAGKSTLIRSLIYGSTGAEKFVPLEAPVPGSMNGNSAIFSTTGEVNLYFDPYTFGTEAPTFYADCEGIMGTEPLAAQHQKEWTRQGRRYPVATKDGKHMDRREAVQSCYPRFLYIFSDVVCYVTRNHKTWADSAFRLLKWSMIGAQNTINQHALPALIIILNGPTLENEEWLSGNPDAATEDFFSAIEKEINENNYLRDLANKYEKKTMKKLFSRSFSSVYVHYVPLEGYKSGTPDSVLRQTQKLAHRVRKDSERVQAMRADSWTRFDARQLSLIVHYAFTHLASGSTEPFDFGQCRQQVSIPESTEEHFSEALSYCLEGNIGEKFLAAGKVLASNLLRQSIKEEKKNTVLLPSVVFNKDIQSLCSRAVSHFLRQNVQCAFVDPESGQGCVNTEIGHAQGHQSKSGGLLKEGLFMSPGFDSKSFLTKVEDTVHKVMLDIHAKAPSSRLQWRILAAEIHRENLAELRSLNGFPHISEGLILHDIRQTNVCYGCFFGRAEYRLPCDHVICEYCVQDFDDTPIHKRYPSWVVHDSCIICQATDHKWPYKIQIKPDLAGVRVLSLDGGGVRGIVEITTLLRLQHLIGLGIPIGQLFDLVIGTSAGGIIALGLGAKGLDMKECRRRFYLFVQNGFDHKTLTKAPGLSWVARWFRGSIYHTGNFESALRGVFASGPGCEATQLYGLQHPCRVAVTTTAGVDLKLIANYHPGGTGHYVDSRMDHWKAARCTSAAPMYFEGVLQPDNVCYWDGGLKANNPIQDAVSESKTIWGKNVNFDLLLSVGSGKANAPAKQPNYWNLVPESLINLVRTFFSTMDGQAAWNTFRRTADDRLLGRSTRLNVQFSEQPKLDDIGKVLDMEQVAANQLFYNKSRPSSSIFEPIQGLVPHDTLQCLAVRLRASLFFFEMKYMEDTQGTIVIRGCICCRLPPDSPGFEALMKMTRGFYVAGEHLPLSKLYTGGKRTPFRPSVLIHDSRENLDGPIRIDVDFHEDYRVAISGFPMTLKALFDWGNENSDNLQAAWAGL